MTNQIGKIERVPLRDAGKKSLSALTAALKSVLLLFLIFFPLEFLHVVAHEGGHALINLIHRVQHTVIFVHPFSFSGYSRPIADYPWFHAFGPIVGVLLPLLIFIPLWKHRSVANLFLVMLFPWSTFWEAFNIFAILMRNGDWYNIIRLTSLPEGFFMAVGVVMLIVGGFFILLLFPLLGLKPEDRNSLWVVPAGMLLWALVGFGIAHWLLPGSSVLVRYNLVIDTIQTANFWLPLMTAIGIVLALAYVTLYRGLYRKLPAGLRTEAKELAWRDLRWPAAWSAVSIVIGLIVIR
jgi:hypothetical protein